MVATKSNNILNKLSGAKEINYTPLLLLVVILLQVVVIFTSIFNGALELKSQKEAPSRFVELVNGQTLKVKPISSKERSPEAIDKFTRSMMINLFSASNNLNLSEHNFSKDLGAEIDEKTITERAAVSLLFLGSEIFPLVLEDITGATPPEVFEAKLTRVLKITELSEPQKIKEGHWELGMIGTLLILQNQKLSLKRFNKRIQIKAVDYPIDTFQSLSLDLNQKILDSENKEYLKQLFYELSNAGLEISAISKY